MKLTMIIDGNQLSVNSGSDVPLSRILLDNVETFPANNACMEASCGNCVVMLNGTCVLSCLIPACKLNGASILTFEGFKKTRAYYDIEKAYNDNGIKPCKQCYASKTLLIESILQKLEKTKKKIEFAGEFISCEISINKCRCIDSFQIEKIVKRAYMYRSRRSGRQI